MTDREWKPWESIKIERFKFLDSVEHQEEIDEQTIDTLIEYGIRDTGIGENGWFIRPCIRAIGVKEVSKKVEAWFMNGTEAEQVGALKLWYM